MTTFYVYLNGEPYRTCLKFEADDMDDAIEEWVATFGEADIEIDCPANWLTLILEVKTMQHWQIVEEGYEPDPEFKP